MLLAPKTCGKLAITFLGKTLLLNYLMKMDYLKQTWQRNPMDFFTEKIKLIRDDLDSNPVPLPGHLIKVRTEFQH